ncbi:hypothetical protein C8J57DRAFT_1254979 [Mycena rebaudengoi]|nr:hypothetical protein C8J57DRAFT_1254979 [Mycena rebaudengoi]
MASHHVTLPRKLSYRNLKMVGGRKPSLGVKAAKPRRVITSYAAGSRGVLKSVTPATLNCLRDISQKELVERVDNLSEEARLKYNKLRDISNPEFDHDQNSEDDDSGDKGPVNNELGPDDILNAQAEFMGSHAGGEFRAMLEEQVRDSLKEKRGHRKTKDHCKRRDVIEKKVNGFAGQIEAMVDTYIAWRSTQGENSLDQPYVPPATENIQKHYAVRVVDIFSTYIVNTPMLYSDQFTTCSLICEGLMPCAPFTPTVTIATRVLEMFHIAHLRTPTITIQSWVKTLSDLHGVAFKPYLSQQFSVTETRVKKVLGRDVPDCRLKTTCPACTYKLEGEVDLIFDMLVTMDGNDSLKRVLRKERCDYDDNGKPLPSASKERKDPRVDTAGKDYYLSRETVDLWAKEQLAELVKAPEPQDPAEKNLCQERWKNLSEDMTSRMWGVFDETDMVRSGELAKYPLAIVDALLDAFGPKLGVGYDIGCGFGTTVCNSPLGKKAKDLKMKTLVGAFHGHAHNRLCQLEYLANYVPGMGLEDLEGCPFDMQVSSIRKQTIVSYMSHHDDFESYANLSTFLVNNYWQAIEIIDGEPALQVAMQAAGIQDVSEFRKRLDMEKKYLTDLKTDDEENTLQMEYYQKLHVPVHRSKLDKAIGEGSRATQVTRQSCSGELLMEHWLPFSSRKSSWPLKSDGCRPVMNRRWLPTWLALSGTGLLLAGWKDWHSRQGPRQVRSALVSYNDAAASLATPARKLSWSEVVEYAFLADFDLLRNPEELAEIQPWEVPASHEIMDAHFKIEQACEEIFGSTSKYGGWRERGRFDEVPGVRKQDPVQEPALMEGVVDANIEASRLQALESEQAALNLAAQLDRTHINSEDVIHAGEEEAEVDDYVGEVQESEEVAENLHLILQASTD